ncbi:DUF6934 family protein [Spirosoma linguale]|uniref:Uncharacterized protein n=1 Tax=Spirosoma linguale (strain ATCC 33905 / DSM 74 / LMG 10896 / Claus 1) TaxID=504472 RepID=D2QU37_SPILD|nr:hypothetical protein Slin_6360 [Spirosoma linguale DSM 74]
MQLERYEVHTVNAHDRFEFVSVGNNGDILKVVEFIVLDEDGHIYNLGFGDVNPLTGEWDDKSVSNNGDRNKILATVGSIVVSFLDTYTEAAVYAQGSTRIRNILYQRTIERFWQEIAGLYDVRGYKETGEWVSFERGGPFIAFLIKRK